MMEPDLSGLVLGSQYEGEDVEEADLGRRVVADAVSYLTGFDWCDPVVEVWAGIMVPPVLGVVLAQIDARDDDVDEWLWVVVGDLPSAYINFDDRITPNAACALDSYVGNMQHWAEAVEHGRSVEDEYPVDAEPTLENARSLRLRLRFIDERILVDYPDELRRRSA
jgi:hypothetical protein